MSEFKTKTESNDKLTDEQTANWEAVMNQLDDGECHNPSHVEGCICRQNVRGCYRIADSTGGSTAIEGVENRNKWAKMYGVEPFFSLNSWWVRCPDYLSLSSEET